MALILARKKINTVISDRWNPVSCLSGLKSYFWREKKKKTEAASGLCRENARYIEILELMTLKILAKHDVNRMIDCALMATIIVLTYAHCEGKVKSAHF